MEIGNHFSLPKWSGLGSVLEVSGGGLGDRVRVLQVALDGPKGLFQPWDAGIPCSLCQPCALVCAVSSLPKQPIPTGLISFLPSLQTLALFIRDKSCAIAGPFA